MLEVKGTAVRISRGDTARIVIELDTPPADGTKALVTMKRKPGMEQDVLWEKTVDADGSSVTVNIESSDTNHRPGVYWWDVRLKNGELVQTLFEPAPFEVIEVVGSV